MNEAEIRLDDRSLGEMTNVGHLTRGQSKTGDTVRFEYSQPWLEGAGSFALDQEFILASGALYAQTGADELSGIFLDCSPDR